MPHIWRLSYAEIGLNKLHVDDFRNLAVNKRYRLLTKPPYYAYRRRGYVGETRIGIRMPRVGSKKNTPS